MAQNNTINLPSSGGGIMRFNDENKTKVMMTPQQVLVIIGVVILLEIVLHLFGNSFFGI